MSLSILHLTKPGLTKTGAITLGLLTSLLFWSSSQLPVQAFSLSGSSFIDYNEFDDEEDDFVDIEETTETVEDTDSLIAQFATNKGWSGCYNTRVGNTYRNYLGGRIFGYFQEINHCWQGSRVTSARLVNRWAELYNVPLVHFNGHIGQWRQGNTFWTQGSFSACLGWKGIGCFMNYTPIIRMWPRGWGQIGYSYRSLELPSDQDLINDSLGGLFLADDLDEDTKTQFLALAGSLNSIDDTQSVPEPATLLGLGLVGLFLFKTRKFRSFKPSQNNPENEIDIGPISM